MKKSLFIRLAILTTAVMTILPALMPLAPASAAPVQGDNYWEDTFGDSTGISASTNVAISGGEVRLASTSSTEVLRPTGAGSQTSITNQEPSSSAHWDKVDEATAEDNTTFVYQMGTNEDGIWRRDLYAIQDHSQGSGAISSVTVNFRCKRYQNDRNGYARASISTHSTTYDGATKQISPYDSWVTYTEVWTTNPNTGQAWTWAEIDAMEIGVSLQNTHYYVFPWWAASRVACTQVYLEVAYQPSGSLNSVSITPANLQSWGTFYANDNTAWPYSKPISITGTGTALTNYQITFPISYVAEKMKTDFSDLRFKDGSGNMLSYWIESYTASASAQVWVKVPAIAASGTTTIYMYYGNPAASSASNESAVFDYVDRGNQTASWSVTGTAGQSTSQGNPAPSYYANSSSGNYLSRNIDLVPGRIITFNVKTSGLGNLYFLTNSSGSGQMYRLDTRESPEHSGFASTASWTVWNRPSEGFRATANQWYKFTIVITSATSATLYYSQTTDSSPSGFGTLRGTFTINNRGGFIGLVGDVLGPSYITYWDNIVVRKYAATEPTISTGSETAISINYKILNATNDAVLCTITAAQAAAGYDISSCAAAASSIKLRAELSTSGASHTPILYDWKVTWSSAVPVAIDITAPADISSWTASPAGGGENTISGNLIINVTPDGTSWTATAKDTDAATAGYLTQWSGAYGTAKLANAMRVQGPAGEVTLPVGGAIASGAVDTTVTITFKQKVEWTDAPGDYRIVVTFIGAVVP